jgi:hypothetical protein
LECPLWANRRHRLGYSITSSASESTVIRHRKIHRLRCFHIDDEQIARRDLDWQIGGLLALKNTGSQRCRAIEGLASVGAIGHQAAITGHEVLLPGCS